MSNPNSWVTLLPPAGGAGPGHLGYTVEANTSSIARTGLVTVAGQTYTIRQNGSTCVYALQSLNQTHSYLASTGTVAVTSPAGCPWMVSNTNGWITILSTTNGFGNGQVTYALAYQPDGQNRTGQIAIAGQNFTVVQTGNICPVTLPLTSRNHGEGAETNSFIVNVSACAWTATTTNPWIVLINTAGSGNGTLNYRITANPALDPRTGTIHVSGREFTVTQVGASCLYSLSTPQGFHPAGIANGLVTLTTVGPACAWTVLNTNTWLEITSPTSGSAGLDITYTLTNNPDGQFRTGVVVIAGMPYSIIQTGAPCAFLLADLTPSHTFAAATNTIALSTLTGCPWTALNTDSWINILSPSGQTNSSGFLTYAVQDNPAALTRIGVVVVGDQHLTITQTGVACTTAITPTNRAHAATLTTNAVNVTAPVGCTWNVSNSLPWVTILPYTGTSNGVVTYTVAANPSSFGRTGTVTIANHTFTLTQSGSACTYGLTPSNVLVAAAGEFLMLNLDNPRRLRLDRGEHQSVDRLRHRLERHRRHRNGLHRG